MTCKHRFLDRLKKVQGWPQKFIRFRHGVILPDSMSPDQSSAVVAQYEKIIFCFSTEFDKDFGGWITKRLESHSKGNEPEREYGPGEDGLNALISLVADPVCLRVPIKKEIQGELETLDRLLTGAQLALISLINVHQKVLIEGGAGTGKTLLALEMAARFAQNGKKVLFTCKSTPLANYIKNQLINFQNIDVFKFDNLELKINKILKEESLNNTNIWSVILVDEGQDFDWEWWDLILNIASTSSTLLRVFADSNQAVYRLKDDLETRLNAISYQLKINLRNTKSIAEVTNSLYKGPLIEAPGPDGKWPEIYLTNNTKEAINETLIAIKNLLKNEGFLPEMISVLTPDAEIREQVIAELWKINIPARDASKSLNSSVTVESVARFKGLESPIIILISDKVISKNQELSYVAVSRARSRLIIYGPVQNSILQKAISDKPN
jgi:superfamily I DNA/RNA helicase